ncbi:DUF350 domain-containing protein [Aureibacter tunicatorum]|uniref:Uncharacterized membrane protein YjfL (UPF0719 family) n=1 Tax=Aureibacter tunicatorum TaxID=866807 RepID=A0AAE3XP32_9BACT|nr:DUF350 domain-containing protein [Aureibacter tunicatorum]MDR6238654.1 uncharacterized membrane protein YjfL (UPF0719 family) [Aureibacter tunicatorum]BDD05415.1 hypothetical protein AUTU_28980 [Aureibacter tunicatorum]
MDISNLLNGILASLVYLGASFVLVVLGKIAYQIFHPNISVKHELVEKDNLAFSVAHVGYFVGLLLAIGAAISGESNGLLNDFIQIELYGIVAIVLLNLSVYINDKIILSKFDIKKEIITDQNVGTGAVDAAISISTGLIIMGAIIGDGGDILTAIYFWLIGQAILILTSFVYNLITPYDIHEHIEKNNIAVGIGFGGALIAIANLIRNGLATEFYSWQESLMLLGFEVLLGLIFLPLARLMTDKILLPGRNLTDEIVNQDKPNVGAALIEAFSYIGGSTLICWAI